jgi:hypothetical protein
MFIYLITVMFYICSCKSFTAQTWKKHELNILYGMKLEITQFNL